MSVSVTSGLLDLFAPKFAMDALGVPGEKVTIRVLVGSKDGSRRVTLFGTYTIGGRHAQITSRRLAALGPEVDVHSIERYSLKDFVEDVSELVAKDPMKGKPELRWEDGKVWLVVDGTVLQASVDSMHVAAAQVFALLECQRKNLRIALGDEVELFDSSRRRLSGMRMKDGKLILERAFQNAESKEAPSGESS
ncbi:MAG: hypothetical protein ABSF83_10395 [Nitrososphaerales archaeon]